MEFIFSFFIFTNSWLMHYLATWGNIIYETQFTDKTETNCVIQISFCEYFSVLKSLIWHQIAINLRNDNFNRKLSFYAVEASQSPKSYTRLVRTFRNIVGGHFWHSICCYAECNKSYCVLGSFKTLIHSFTSPTISFELCDCELIYYQGQWKSLLNENLLL